MVWILGGAVLVAYGGLLYLIHRAVRRQPPRSPAAAPPRREASTGSARGAAIGAGCVALPVLPVLTYLLLWGIADGGPSKTLEAIGGGVVILGFLMMIGALFGAGLGPLFRRQPPRSGGAPDA